MSMSKVGMYISASQRVLELNDTEPKCYSEHIEEQVKLKQLMIVVTCCVLIAAVGSILRKYIHACGQIQEEKSGHEGRERVGVVHISLPEFKKKC